MKKLSLTKFSITVLGFITGFASQAQQTDRLIPNVISPAPEAAAFGKYGDFPVSMYTGVPTISVPLYEIKSRDASLPITLSYHAGGIQVKEEASWVGLGWTLNAGGAVTRNIRGTDDFQDVNGFLVRRTNMPKDPTNNPLQTPSVNLYFDQNDNYSVNLPDGDGITRNYYSELSNSAYDWASDIYYFNCGKLSGKFLIDRDGQMRVLDHSDIKIEITKKKDINGAETNTLAGWKVTDDDGTQYFFGNSDYSVSNSLYDPYYQYSSTRATEKKVNGYTQAANQLRDPNVYNTITSWFVKKIIYPSGEAITFEYDKPQLNPNSSIIDDIIAPLPDYSNYMIAEANSYCENTPAEGRISISHTVHQAHYLRKINFTNGYILFDRDPQKRQDLSGANRLSSISIYQRAVGTMPEKLVRTFALTHTYFTTVSDPYPDYSGLLASDISNYVELSACNSKRLRLDAITESNDGVSQKYSFSYSAVQLPKKTSYAVDHWGYFNGKYNPHLVPQVDWDHFTIYRVVYKDGNSIKEPIIVEDTHYDGANRDADGNFAVAASLKSITYPTKGSTEYVFESNNFIDNDVLKNGGGLRVARINNLDRESGKTMFTFFTYEDGKQITPVRYFMVKYCQYGTSAVVKGLGMPDGAGWITYLMPNLYRYSSVIYPMSNAAAGSPIGYNKVTRSQGTVGAEAANGKSVFEFHNEPDAVLDPNVNGFVYWPGIPGMSDGQNGNLQMQTDYARDVDQPDGFRKVRTVKNNYVDLNISYPTKTKFYWNRFVHTQPGVSGSSVGMWTYPVPTIWNHLESAEESVFDNSGSETKTITKFTYHNAPPASTPHHQLLSKSLTKSDGKINNTLYHYPADYNNAAMGGTIQTLKASNMMNRVVEERMIDSETDGNTLSGSVITYDNKGLPVLYNLAENTGPLAGITTNAANINPDANVFQPRVELSYDGNSNLTTKRKSGGTPTAYIWSYNNTLPIAEVKNAESGTTIFYTGFEATSNSVSLEAKTGNQSFSGTFVITKPQTNGDYVLSYWKKSSTPGGDWQFIRDIVTISGGSGDISIGGTGYIIDDVRLYPVGAQMSTYTYDPLTGVTSVTGVDDLITYYEYDGLGRLKLIRDGDRNIVKMFSYQYKN